MIITDKNGNKFEFKIIYSWFDVYVNNTMILHHISKEDADSLIKTIKTA